MKFTIPGPMPGLNEYIAAERSNRFKAAKMKTDWERLVIACARRDLPKGWKASGRVEIRYTFYERDRRRDYDNIQAWAVKVVQDSLVKGDWIQGDGQKRVSPPVTAFEVDKARPRVEVEITEVNNDTKRNP